MPEVIQCVSLAFKCLVNEALGDGYDAPVVLGSVRAMVVAARSKLRDTEARGQLHLEITRHSAWPSR